MIEAIRSTTTGPVPTHHANKSPATWAGLVRVTVYALAGVVGLYAAWSIVGLATSSWASEYAFGNGDLNGYLDGVRRFLETGSPYLPAQLAPWHLEPHSFIHPPIALLLFAPFLWLPTVLWWAIPILGTVGLIASSRPGPWRLLAVALCLAWPRSGGSILAGNTDLWAMFFVAGGVRFGWPFALLALKPTFAPLAVFGIRDRRTWVGGLAVGLVALAFGGLWLDYLTVIRGTDLTPGYSLLNLPLVALPVMGMRRTGSFLLYGWRMAWLALVVALLCLGLGLFWLFFMPTGLGPSFG